MRVFRRASGRDKTRTQAFDMSELGLVEMTRKRISEGLVESFSETCPTCHGRGFLLDESLLRSNRLGFRLFWHDSRDFPRHVCSDQNGWQAVQSREGRAARSRARRRRRRLRAGAQARAPRRRRYRFGDTERARGRGGEGQGRRRRRGPKIDGFIYKPKSNNRRRYGHRQDLSVLEITAINKGRARRATSAAKADDESDEPEAVEPKAAEET